MTPEPDLDLIFVYVAGVADTDEVARAETLLSSGSPAVAGAYAEAVAVFHAMPLNLTAIEPPAAVRDAVFGRVSADAAATGEGAAPMWPATASISAASKAPASNASMSPDYATRLRWPVYVTSGLAACFAVALTLSVWNNYQMADRTERMSAAMAKLSDSNSKLVATEDLLRSPQLSLVSLKAQKQAKPQCTGRVLFCPSTRQYQVTVFGLDPLPPEKAYELWLITPDQRKIPAGMFAMDENGLATVISHTNEPLDGASVAAITDEPAGGSPVPTGMIHLVGELHASR